jgi:hypothetical protein
LHHPDRTAPCGASHALQGFSFFLDPGFRRGGEVKAEAVKNKSRGGEEKLCPYFTKS